MKQLFLYTLLILLCGAAHAQDTTHLWKKHVVRTIDMSAPSLRDNAIGIAQYMLGMLTENKVNVYSPFGNDTKYENDKLAKWQYEELTSTIPDTEYNYNSTTRKTDRTPRKRNNFNPDSVYKFNLLEEWTFDPFTDKITIEIQYIEPLTDRYSKEGEYLGCQSAFRM